MNNKLIQKRSKPKTRAKISKIPKSQQKKSYPVPVYVVDLHNGAMPPFLKAVRNRELEKRGNKMLHFDSHPDLGNIDKRTPFMYKVAQEMKFPKQVYELTDIATWITPLVLAGQLDEVIWVAGHWCKQIRAGTYHLVCGMDKTDGKLKTADQDGTNSSHAIENYWECDGAAGKLENMNYQKPWKLHVVKYTKQGDLRQKDIDLIHDVCVGHPWVLDIDEDFFSCNNPYRDNFAACFGDRTFRLMQKIYEIGTGADLNIKKILEAKLFMKSKEDFLKHKTTRFVINALNEEDLPGLKLMEEFQDSFKGYYEKPTVEKTDDITVDSLMEFDEIHETGTLSGLPHHISRVDEIARMGTATQNLLKCMDRPAHVTLATSRTDRYLPDCQAAIIHGMLDEMMENVYGNIEMIRRDKPMYSVNIDD